MTPEYKAMLEQMARQWLRVELTGVVEDEEHHVETALPGFVKLLADREVVALEAAKAILLTAWREPRWTTLEQFASYLDGRLAELVQERRP